MWLNGKLKFDAVVEGISCNFRESSCYKLVLLNIPEKVEILNDGVYNYDLHYKAEDFRIVRDLFPDEVIRGLEARVNFLGLCEGIIFSINRRSFGRMLDRPRAVFMRNGRIYIERSLRHDEAYLKGKVPSIIGVVRRIFESPNYSKFCEEITKNNGDKY